MMQKNNIIIRQAKNSDAEQIGEIEKNCFSQPWTVNQIKKEINNEKAIFIVASADDIICGYISGQLIIDEFYISNIAVSSDFRNLGIATAIIKKLIEILMQMKCALLSLEVRESNVIARKLYENTGFVNLGLRKNFYSAPKENACIYTLYLTNPEKECID